MSKKPLFKLGSLVATRGVIALNLQDSTIPTLLFRHVTGDWGEICPEDKGINEDALIQGWRIMSVYTVNETKIWVITEWDRSVTTLLLPEEY